MEAYPNAKVVLTVRKPDTWHKSVMESIYNGHILRNDFAVRIFLGVIGKRRNLDMVDDISLHPPRGFKKGKAVR
jgi:hypothetical protein